MKISRIMIALGLAAGLAAGPALAQDKAPGDILNVSYDISRELFQQINQAFAAQLKASGAAPVEVRQSHAGSSKQARAIIEGLAADVVTFNQVTDVQILADKGLVRGDWQTALPNGASPYYSLPAFVVRKGNPKSIRDWSDLARPDVKVVFPNPKTSGNGRYTYLAAYAYALEAFKGDQAQARDFIRKIIANVPVFDTGGRGATTTFVERNTGDVLVTFEAEVNGVLKEFGPDKFDKVVPPVSLLAEFPVAVVDKVVDKRGSRKVAAAYLDYLYSEPGQEILAQNGYRVRNERIARKYAGQFPPLRLYTIDLFGGWGNAQTVHFAEGGTFDRAFERK
jgi:sulfate transport system substrate-binding protein